MVMRTCLVMYLRADKYGAVPEEIPDSFREFITEMESTLKRYRGFEMDTLPRPAPRTVYMDHEGYGMEAIPYKPSAPMMSGNERY